MNLLNNTDEIRKHLNDFAIGLAKEWMDAFQVIRQENIDTASQNKQDDYVRKSDEFYFFPSLPENKTLHHKLYKMIVEVANPVFYQSESAQDYLNTLQALYEQYNWPSEMCQALKGVEEDLALQNIDYKRCLEEIERSRQGVRSTSYHNRCREENDMVRDAYTHIKNALNNVGEHDFPCDTFVQEMRKSLDELLADTLEVIQGLQHQSSVDLDPLQAQRVEIYREQKEEGKVWLNLHLPEK